MSTDSHPVPPSKEITLLVALKIDTIMSIQIMKIECRVTINSQSWMERSDQRWLTLQQFIKIFGDRVEQMLRAYDPRLTIHSLQKVNEGLAE